MTKIGIITDIHIGEDLNKQKDLSLFIEKLDADFLVISGDLVRANIEELNVLFKIIKEANPFLKIFVVFGNHDVWDEKNKFRSLTELLSERDSICKKWGVHYLEENMFEDDDVEIYGYDGWYLYSNPKTNDKDLMPRTAGLGELTPFQYMQRKEQGAVQYIFDELEKRKKSKKTKIVVTHFNPFPQGEESHLYEHMCGNERIFNLIIDEGINFFIFGHSHHAIEYKKKKCHVINVGADYNKAPSSTEFSKILEIKKKS